MEDGRLVLGSVKFVMRLMVNIICISTGILIQQSKNRFRECIPKKIHEIVNVVAGSACLKVNVSVVTHFYGNMRIGEQQNTAIL